MTERVPARVRRARERQDRLLARLPDLREILRGSLVERYRRCGRPNCHCARKDDPGHGPAYYLVVTVGSGETVQIYVRPEERAAVEGWIENFQRVRRTLEKVSAINRGLLRDGHLFEDG